jgi:hypothetical protein
MNAGRSLLGRYALVAGLGLADLALTAYLLRTFPGRLGESNPLAQWCLSQGGWAGLVAFKAAVIALVVGAAAAIARHRPRAARRVLAFACVATVVVLVYSATLIAAVPSHAGVLDLYDDAAIEARTRCLDAQVYQWQVRHKKAGVWERNASAPTEYLAGRSPEEARSLHALPAPGGDGSALEASLPP